MAKFYGGRGAVFPGLPAASPATVPIIRQSAVVQPESLPEGGVVSASPAGFAPYMIRPEIIGSLPQKQIVPPLWPSSTEANFLDRGIFTQPVDITPVAPVGARPLFPPTEPTQIFQTQASNAAAASQQASLQASIAARQALELQNKADKAAYDASQAASAVAMDPTPDKAGAADAAALLAQQTQTHADWANNLAQQRDAVAAQHAVVAQAAADQADVAYDARVAANANAVAQGDDKALNTDTPYIWGDGQVGPVPPMPVVEGPTGIPGMSSSAYLLPVGGAAAAGFLAAGPMGAIIGALLGGGYAYMKSQSSSPQMVVASPVPGSMAPPPPPLYVGESFVPYQEGDGTWIMSQQAQAAYALAHGQVVIQ